MMLTDLAPAPPSPAAEVRFPDGRVIVRFRDGGANPNKDYQEVWKTANYLWPGQIERIASQMLMVSLQVILLSCSTMVLASGYRGPIIVDFLDGSVFRVDIPVADPTQPHHSAVLLSDEPGRF